MEKEILKKMLEMLAGDFNCYSELIALCHLKKKQGKCDENLLQWGRGSLDRTMEYMQWLACQMEVEIIFERREHIFVCNGCEWKLEYETVHTAI